MPDPTSVPSSVPVLDLSPWYGADPAARAELASQLDAALSSVGLWTSNRHRVLPPAADAPQESLISLVYFHETNHDTVVEALQPPIGRPNQHEPVLASAFLRERLDAISIGG